MFSHMDRGSLKVLRPYLRGTGLCRIDRLFVAPANLFHEARSAPGLRGGEQQMDVVSHQHVGVDGAFEAGGECAQSCQEHLPVVFVKKALRLAAAATNYVQGSAGRWVI